MSSMEKPNKRHNVAIVYHVFAHYRGGIVRELHEQGAHSYTFFADDVDRHSKIKPYDYRHGERFVKTNTKFFKKNFLWQSKVVGLAFSREFDTLIFLGDAQFMSTWVSAFLARLLGKQVLYWSIGWIENESGPKDRIRCTFYRLAHKMLFYGNWAKQLALDRGFKNENLHVVFNSLDIDKQIEARSKVKDEDLVATREKLFPGSHLPLLVCSSRLTAKRKLDQLLKAMHILKQKGHPLNLLLIGDGEEEERLKSMAKDLELSVHFYGACYDENLLAPLIMCSSLTVAPGMVGLTAMQSLIYGTPVVTHDEFEAQAPEWEAVVPDVSGAFFKNGDVEDLARVIEQWTQSEYPDQATRDACHWVIDNYYNPQSQRKIIDAAVSGEPAKPLQWIRDVWKETHAA